jgi:hypothetical protein
MTLEEVIEKVIIFWTAGAREILTDRDNERIVEIFSRNLENFLSEEMDKMSDGEYIHLYSDYGPKHFLREISKGNIPEMYFPLKARMNVYKALHVVFAIITGYIVIAYLLRL